MDSDATSDAPSSSSAMDVDPPTPLDDVPDKLLALAVDALVARHIPMDSSKYYEVSDPNETNHLQVLHELLSVLQTGGTLLLLGSLRLALREGDQHRYWRRIRRALTALADNVNYAEPAAVAAVVGVCTGG